MTGTLEELETEIRMTTSMTSVIRFVTMALELSLICTQLAGVTKSNLTSAERIFGWIFAMMVWDLIAQVHTDLTHLQVMSETMQFVITLTRLHQLLWDHTMLAKSVLSPSLKMVIAKAAPADSTGILQPAMRAHTTVMRT